MASVPRPVPSTATTPSFVSPFHPPPGFADLTSDVAAHEDSGSWHTYTRSDRLWRLKVPVPQALHMFVTAVSEFEKSQVRRNAGLTDLIQRHMHPDDFLTMLTAMVDPDDPFDDADMIGLMRAVVTTGSARPFARSPRSRSRRRTTGGRSGRN